MDYIYHGDRLAKIQSKYAGQQCRAVRRTDGKCIRGRNSNMLVEFLGGVQVVVPARMLRKISQTNNNQPKYNFNGSKKDTTPNRAFTR